MADASYTQTSFLGGEVSQWAQGSFDKPWYKISLNRAFNSWITDEACITRRPGFRFLGITRKGNPGRLMAFDFTQFDPYNIELTDGFMRFWNDRRLVTTNDSQIIVHIDNSVSPTVFTLAHSATWITGDSVTFSFNTPQGNAAGGTLLNRQFVVTMLTSTTLTLTDPTTNTPFDLNVSFPQTITSAILDGPISSGPDSDTSISGSPVNRTIITTLSPSIHHIYEIPTPYSIANHDWHSIRLVQGANNDVSLGVFLQATIAPQSLKVTTQPTSTNDAVFSFTQPAFQDGPYLDPPVNAIATPNSASNYIQVVVGYPAWSSSTLYGINANVVYSGIEYISLQNNNSNNQPDISPTFWKSLGIGSMVNSGQGFVVTDLNRLMRFFSEPPLWDSGTTYNAGNNVAFGGSYFTALTTSAGAQPDLAISAWVLNPSAAIWTWGIITVVTSANTVTVQLQGAPLLYTSPIRVWRVGAWSDTTGWPTCGCYQEGRFYYAGAIPNRFDASEPNQPFIMAPTSQDGTVTDSNAISYTLNAEEQNKIVWMTPDDQGVLAGTQEAEFLITSGGNGAPITASNIQARRKTKYGSSDIQPVRTGVTICFVKRFAKRVLEYLADIFSNRFFGPELTINARHLGARVIEELAYQEERIPTLWARCFDGTLIGTTYRRISMISTQPPEFNAWHQHKLGSNRLIESITVGPSFGGSLDALGIISNDPSNGIRFVEQMTPITDETDPLTLSWFLDSAVTPPGATLGNNGITFGGLDYLNGQQVSAFVAGIDCGDYIVNKGQITVPLGTNDPISGNTLTLQTLEVVDSLSEDFPDLSVIVMALPETYTIPCVIGFNYQSQGQLCRPQMQQDTGARTGPGHGKKRRSSRYTIQVVNSLGIQVGTDFNKPMYQAPFGKIDAGGKKINYLDTFSGIMRETLHDDFSYDSMLAWKTTRPYPATITAIGAMIETQDI